MPIRGATFTGAFALVEAVIHSVTVASQGLVTPVRLRVADELTVLH